jgi:acetylglutamate/LysW-gamma-L-alpha-aminoadipate kinase
MPLIVVIKIGGRMAQRPYVQAIASDVCSLIKEHKFIVVHGGGNVVTEYAERMGVEQKFVVSPAGVRSRYTDAETLKVCQMALRGLVNAEVVGALVGGGANAIGLSGLDCCLVRARRRKAIISIQNGRRIVMDGGYSGKPSDVNLPLLCDLMKMSLVPVIAPLGLDEESHVVNMDSDSVASVVAAAVKADVLLFLTDVEGVLLAGRPLPRIEFNELEEIVSSVGFGMNRKLIEAAAAIRNGVSKVIISSGKLDRPVKAALEDGAGTVVTRGDFIE